MKESGQSADCDDQSTTCLKVLNWAGVRSDITGMSAVVNAPLSYVIDGTSGTLKGNASWLGQESVQLISELLDDLDNVQKVVALKAAVAEMPGERLRSDDGDSVAWIRGMIMHEVASQLYKVPLPLDLDDLIELLSSAVHRCGHGGDVRPPFELAHRHQISNGWSPRLADAMGQYAANMTGRSAKATGIRQLGALLSVLDGHRPLRSDEQPLWISSVRTALADFPQDERAHWVRLFVHLKGGDAIAIPKRWRGPANKAIEELGTELIIRRLNEWWPPDTTKKVNTGGSGIYFMKHLIWLADLTETDQVTALAVRTARLNWSSRKPINILAPNARLLHRLLEDDFENAELATALSMTMSKLPAKHRPQ